MKCIRGLKSHILKYSQRYLAGIFFLGSILGFVLIYSHIVAPQPTTGSPYISFTDIVRYYGALFTICAILLATIQFKANNDWNKRQFAMKTCKEIWDDLDKDVEILNKAFNLSELTSDSEISIEEIHDKICAKTPDGKFAMGKASKYTLDMGGDGHKIYSAIANRLAGFEYLYMTT